MLRVVSVRGSSREAISLINSVVQTPREISRLCRGLEFLHFRAEVFYTSESREP